MAASPPTDGKRSEYQTYLDKHIGNDAMEQVLAYGRPLNGEANSPTLVWYRDCSRDSCELLPSINCWVHDGYTEWAICVRQDWQYCQVLQSVARRIQRPMGSFRLAWEDVNVATALYEPCRAIFAEAIASLDSKNDPMEPVAYLQLQKRRVPFVERSLRLPDFDQVFVQANDPTFGWTGFGIQNPVQGDWPMVYFGALPRHLEQLVARGLLQTEGATTDEKMLMEPTLCTSPSIRYAGAKWGQILQHGDLYYQILFQMQQRPQSFREQEEERFNDHAEDLRLVRLLVRCSSSLTTLRDFVE